MNYRELYKRAMRSYRITRAQHTGVDRYNVLAFVCAVRVVREVTGHWQIPEPPSPWEHFTRHRVRRRSRLILCGPTLTGVRFFQSH